MVLGELADISAPFFGCLVAQPCLTVFVTLWTVALQAPPSMRMLQVRTLGWVPFPPPGDILPDPGVEPKPQAPFYAILFYKIGLMVT